MFFGIPSVSAFISGKHAFFTQHESTALYCKAGRCKEVYFSRDTEFEKIPELYEYPSICIFTDKAQLETDPMAFNTMIDRLILYYKKAFLAGGGKSGQTVKLVVDCRGGSLPENGVLENMKIKLEAYFKNAECVDYINFANEYKI